MNGGAQHGPKVHLGLTPLLFPLHCIIFLQKKLRASPIVLCIPSIVIAINICLFYTIQRITYPSYLERNPHLWASACQSETKWPDIPSPSPVAAGVRAWDLGQLDVPALDFKSWGVVQYGSSSNAGGKCPSAAVAAAALWSKAPAAGPWLERWLLPFYQLGFITANNFASRKRWRSIFFSSHYTFLLGEIMQDFGLEKISKIIVCPVHCTFPDYICPLLFLSYTTL